MGKKLSKEMAAEQVAKLFDYYEIDPDDYEDGDQRTAIRAARNKLTRGVMNHRVEITGDEVIKVVQTLKKPIGKDEPITALDYREVDARSKVGAKEDDDDRTRLYMFLGNLSEVGLSNILKLKGVDLGIAETLGTIFLQV